MSVRRGLQCHPASGVTFCQNINHNLLIAKPQGTISSDIVHTMFSLSFTYIFLFAISRRGHHTNSSGSTIKAWPSYQFIRVHYQGLAIIPIHQGLTVCRDTSTFLSFEQFKYQISPFHVIFYRLLPCFCKSFFSHVLHNCFFSHCFR